MTLRQAGMATRGRLDRSGRSGDKPARAPYRPQSTPEAKPPLWPADA